MRLSITETLNSYFINLKYIGTLMIENEIDKNNYY